MTVDEFVKQHGGNPIEVSPFVFLLPDGASYTDGSGGRGLYTFRDPPVDPIRNLREQQAYWKALLDREEKDFRARSAEFALQDSNHLRFPANCPPTPAWATEELRARKEKVQSLREVVAIYEEQLSQTPQAISSAAHQQAVSERRQEAQAQAAERAAIQI